MSFRLLSPPLLPRYHHHQWRLCFSGDGSSSGSNYSCPITAILIIFELTDNYLIILPFMTACIASTLLIRYLKKDSIYTEKLSRKGIDIHLGREVSIMERI